MADEEGTSNHMKITVKTATKKEVVEVSEDATVKDVCILICFIYVFQFKI